MFYNIKTMLLPIKLLKGNPFLTQTPFFGTFNFKTRMTTSASTEETDKVSYRTGNI